MRETLADSKTCVKDPSEREMARFSRFSPRPYKGDGVLERSIPEVHPEDEILQATTRLGSTIRMVQFYINRAGKDLPASRKCELEKANRYFG